MNYLKNAAIGLSFLALPYTGFAKGDNVYAVEDELGNKGFAVDGVMGRSPEAKKQFAQTVFERTLSEDYGINKDTRPELTLSDDGKTVYINDFGKARRKINRLLDKLDRQPIE